MGMMHNAICGCVSAFDRRNVGIVAPTKDPSFPKVLGQKVRVAEPTDVSRLVCPSVKWITVEAMDGDYGWTYQYLRILWIIMTYSSFKFSGQ